MSLEHHARAGTRQRARLVAAGVAAATAGLALLPGPAALAAPAPATTVRCSAGDLAAAVSGAVGGAVLTLAPRCRYVLSSGLEAAVSLAIKGNGDTITAGASGLTLLTVDTGATVSLEDLTLSNGDTAIDDEGTLIVTRSAFTGNNTGILSSGTLTVTRSTFTGNGGAIGGDGTMTVTDSTFTGNGGAIGSIAALTVTDSTFNRNTNGAIASRGTLTVTDSTFSGNSTSGNGGAIATERGQSTLKGDRFTGNTAGGDGGALFNNCFGTLENLCPGLTVTGSTFSGNTAAGGGAIFNTLSMSLTDSTLTGNAATDPINGFGGGLWNGGTGGTTLNGTVISGNKARVDGGGIYFVPGVSGPLVGSVTLTRTQVRANKPDNCAPAGTIAGCTS
jgi:predicted outer membrane repeat protein